MKDKVSIITPLFNAERFICETIDSVLAQTYENWELIIVDDLSTDGGYQIVKSYTEKDDRIKLLQNEINSGAAITRNNAIKYATGKYIAFLDSDDLWLPNKLEIQISFMKEKDIAFSFASYYKIDENGEIKGKHLVKKNVGYRDILKTCSIGCLTAVYDAEKLGKVYMYNIRKRQDFALWLQILKTVDQAYAIPHILAKYRLRDSSISSSKKSVLKYQWSVYREVEKLSIIKSSYYFAYYAVNGIINKYLKH